jgi:hypothetical protein
MSGMIDSLVVLTFHAQKRIVLPLERWIQSGVLDETKDVPRGRHAVYVSFLSFQFLHVKRKLIIEKPEAKFMSSLPCRR